MSPQSPMVNRESKTPSVLIFGATSGIARAMAAQFGRHGYDLLLAGRDCQELNALASDLSLRYGVRTSVHSFDAVAFDTHEAAVRSCLAAAGDALAGVVWCIGYLSPPGKTPGDVSEARRVIDVNFTGCVSALEIVARHLEDKRSGFICGVSSVAGDRGRQSNYLYCAAKAGVSVYLQGLRNRLYRHGVRVVTIKPGFVDTPMTYGRPGLFLVASPERVAKSIVKAVMRGKDVVYVPWFWRPVMFAVRIVPEGVFKRMKL